MEIVKAENDSSPQKKKPEINSITVIGGGSWATALIKIFTEKETIKVNWWLRNKDDRTYIDTYHSNPRYLRSVKLNPSLVKTYSDLKEAMKGTDAVLLGVPAAFLGEAISSLSVEDFQGKYIISAIKGMMPGSNKLVTEHLEDVFEVPHKKICVIGGPCHAEEVAMEKQAYLTIASSSNSLAKAVASAMTNRYINATTSNDLYGVEYSAVIKNVIAIACGIAHGVGYGDNFQAVLVANSLKEIKRFLKRVYKMKRDLSASAYLGDLLVTTYSQFSRNRTFGNMIGRGYSVKAAQIEMEMVAEGYYAVKSIYEIMRGIEDEFEMPITTAVYHVIYEKISPIVEFKILKEKLK